jgi:hypothetical protein
MLLLLPYPSYEVEGSESFPIPTSKLATLAEVYALSATGRVLALHVLMAPTPNPKPIQMPFLSTIGHLLLYPGEPLNCSCSASAILGFFVDVKRQQVVVQTNYNIARALTA